jgi:adenine-specific DNA-methyltransferase
MDKLPLHTPDLTVRNYAALTALFPNAVTETIDENGKVVRAIDANVLQQEINTYVIKGKEERYQFTWPDKRKAILLANSPIAATLRPCREESVNFDTTGNLYIEGDNLVVLKLLRETYLNKVKMIYIDPPYNTGKDRIYKDNFAEDTDTFLTRDGQYDVDGNRMVQNLDSNGRFHTDWLNMIYPRLRVAKDLLADDGVIFISIDDREIHNMRKICDEILGVNSFVAQLVWEKKKKGSFLSNQITNIKEYIIVYCKNKSSFIGLIGEVNSDIETYPCINAINKRELRTIPAGIKSKYKDKDYNLPKGSEISDTTMSIILHSDLVIENGVLAKELVLESNWRYSQVAMTEYAEAQELYITRDLYLRRIVSDARDKTIKDLLPRVGDNPDAQYNDSININNLFESGWGSNEDADEELRQLFGVQKLLDYPKPVRLLFKLIASYRKNDFIILDFFSGSSTTAHAVMQLNAEDKGRRRFIMVQLGEDLDESLNNANSETKKTIQQSIKFLDTLNKPHLLTEIGKERIRRAGTKIKADNPKTTQDLDIGFRVLKLDSTNMKDVYYTPQEVVQMDHTADFVDNIKSDRTSEDLLFQVMLDLGIPLSSKIEVREIDGKPVYYVNNGYLAACFERVDDAIVTQIAQSKPNYAVFRDSSFVSDSTLVNFEQIFKTYSPATVRRVL